MTLLLTPGASSSEYKITAWVIWLGGFCEIVAGALELVPGAHMPIQIALAVIGSILVLCKALGYTSQRTQLKLAAMQHQVALTYDPLHAQRSVGVVSSDTLQPVP